MGVSGRKYTSDVSHRQALVNEYTYSYRLSGMPYGDARKRAEDFVEAGVAEVDARGLQNQPVNFGDHMLREEGTNEELCAFLTARRREGVTDDDIRWWWNMPPLERVLIEKTDEEIRAAAFITCMRQGMDAQNATRRVFQANPKYGDLLDSDDPDRPIPIELKRRIIEWSEKHYRNSELLRRKLEEATSFNALVRSEVFNQCAEKKQEIAFEPRNDHGILVGFFAAIFIFGGLIGLAWLMDQPKEIQSLNERYSSETPKNADTDVQLAGDSAALDENKDNGETVLQPFSDSMVSKETSSDILQRPSPSSLIERKFIVPLDYTGRERHPLVYVSVDKNTDFRVWFKDSSQRKAEELKLDGLAGDRVYFVNRDGDAIYASVFELTRDDLKELRLVTGTGCGVFTDRILETRTWFDSSGKFSRDARFAGRSGTAVFLWLEPQQYLRAVPFESLSEDDRAYVNTQVLTVVAAEAER